MNMYDRSVSASVLVVEDEFLIMEDIAEVLEDKGYEVLRAWNAEEALALVETRDDIRIVFTDVNMPGEIDGLDLAHVVRERWPHIGLIVTSGAVRAAEIELPEQGLFIPKPYPPEAVARTIRQLLGASASGAP